MYKKAENVKVCNGYYLLSSRTHITRVEVRPRKSVEDSVNVYLAGPDIDPECAYIGFISRNKDTDDLVLHQFHPCGVMTDLTIVHLHPLEQAAYNLLGLDAKFDVQ